VRYFYKLVYEINKEDAETEYQLRLNFASSCILPLTIKPINQSKIFPLYFVPTNEMLKLCSAIHTHNKELVSIIGELPGVAKDQFLIESIIGEMQNTNEIEGVSSSREELVESVKSIQDSHKQPSRFYGLAKSYLKLVYSDAIEINQPQDIRRIYDDLVIHEIKPEERPDGQIFRKEMTHVTKRSGSGKIIHQGVYPESEIINHFNNLFIVMKDDHIPNLLKIAIQHYYIGYIHPFYDGNGRTARFMSCYLIKKELGTYSAISLSRACNQNSRQYAEIFERANSAQNRGELNVFIEGFLGLLNQGQKDVLNELNEKKAKLRAVNEKIANCALFSSGKAKTEKDVFYTLAQSYLFSDESGITVKDLYESIQSHTAIGSEQSVRLALHFLQQKGLVDVIGQKPKYYSLSQSFLAE